MLAQAVEDRFEMNPMPLCSMVPERGVSEPHDKLDQGGLAGASWADEGDRLAARRLERNAANCGNGSGPDAGNSRRGNSSCAAGRSERDALGEFPADAA